MCGEMFLYTIKDEVVSIVKLMFRVVGGKSFNDDDDDEITSLYSISVLNCAVKIPLFNITTSPRMHQLLTISIVSARQISLNSIVSNSTFNNTSSSNPKQDWKQRGTKTIMCNYFPQNFSSTRFTENEHTMLMHEDYFKCSLSVTIRFRTVVALQRNLMSTKQLRRP